MTNTLNTPIEALENAYPVEVSAYHLRKPDSGGAGRHPGGRGVVRELTFRAPARVTLLVTRRKSGPPGLAGGQPGAPGRDRRGHGGRWKTAPAESSFDVAPGDRVRIETPGGGGFGRPARPRS
jgi:N-methylhydantoinase B